MSTIFGATRPAWAKLTSLQLLGAVLVGGASRRFGSNKADAELLGVSLLERQLNIVRGTPVTRLAYVGGESRSELTPSVDYVSDTIVGVDASERSSLLGILAALTFARDMQCESAVILGCDVPLVTSHSLQRLVHALGDETFSVELAVASSGVERDHWSIMAASVTALDSLRRAYMQGERAVHRAVAGLQIARVAVADIETTNVNDQATLSDIASLLDSAR